MAGTDVLASFTLSCDKRVLESIVEELRDNFLDEVLLIIETGVLVGFDGVAEDIDFDADKGSLVEGDLEDDTVEDEDVLGERFKASKACAEDESNFVDTFNNGERTLALGECPGEDTVIKTGILGPSLKTVVLATVKRGLGGFCCFSGVLLGDVRVSAGFDFFGVSSIELLASSVAGVSDEADSATAGGGVPFSPSGT